MILDAIINLKNYVCLFVYCTTAHVQIRREIRSCIVTMVTVFKNAHAPAKICECEQNFDRFCCYYVVFSASNIYIGCIFGCVGYFLIQ